MAAEEEPPSRISLAASRKRSGMEVRMAVFEVRNLDFSYAASPDKRVLKGVSFSVEQGEYIAICGKSGSGKTTLIRHLKSVLAPNGIRSGEVLFNGGALEDITLRTQASEIGFVMQNPDSQIVTDKVWHELAFGLESLGCDEEAMRLRVAEMSSYFGIQSWFHKDVAELSGGQKQLLNLASVMAMAPKVLILDEPTSQLDPVAASDFLNRINQLHQELGMTIIITEHRMEEVLPAADKVMVMKDGVIAGYGEPHMIGEQLLENHEDMFFAMPSAMQIFYGTGQRGKAPLTVKEGRIWLNTYLQRKGVKQGSDFMGASSDLLGEKEEETEKETAVLAKEVWFRYGKKLPDVLQGASIQVPEQSIYAVMGGNGTGKSTLLKVICGICKPYRGKVRLKGRVSMLPQNPECLFVKKTVREELEEMLLNEACGEEERREKIQGMAELCNVEQLLDAHPYDLSGGEQQKTALAKVMLTRPDILLLDEPTKGMDNFFKRKFAEILEELKQRGTTILLVSHDVEFCARYAGYVSLFFDGGIITSNTPERFFAENSFYTTAANRIGRQHWKYAVTNEDVIKLCQEK